ncbi:MAG: SIMPL domain-containing protein [Bacteroidota bacterium]
MKSILSLTLLFSVSILPLLGQQKFQDIDSGGLFSEERQQKPRHKNLNQLSPIAISDTSFLITAKILMNLNADSYRLTLSLNQEVKSIQECKKLIDNRIKTYLTAIEPLDIGKDNIYIDRTGQYPIYGYDIEKKTANQIQEGYEINRNIILQVNARETVNQLIDIAAEQSIHDIVKMEHLIHNPEQIYEELFENALGVIHKKKDLYLNASGLQVKQASMVFSEYFEFIFPESRYKKYEAARSSEVVAYSYRSKRFKEDQRKKQTYFYEGMSYSGFDRLINPQKVKVGLQAVFSLQIKFEREN